MQCNQIGLWYLEGTIIKPEAFHPSMTNIDVQTVAFA